MKIQKRKCLQSGGGAWNNLGETMLRGVANGAELVDGGNDDGLIPYHTHTQNQHQHYITNDTTYQGNVIMFVGSSTAPVGSSVTVGSGTRNVLTGQIAAPATSWGYRWLTGYATPLINYTGSNETLVGRNIPRYKGCISTKE